MKRLITIVFLLAATFTCFGQTHSKDHYLAIEKYKDGDYDGTIDLSKKILESQRYNRWDKSNVLYRIADSYKEKLDHDNAIKYFKLAYKAYPADKEMLLELANVYKNNGQYDDARKYFKKYSRKGESAEFALQQINYHDTIMAWLGESPNAEVKLNRELSTSYFDYAPRLIGSNNSTMIITSSRAFEGHIAKYGRRSKLFYTKNEGGNWAVPTLLDTSINKVGAEGVLSMDNKRNVVFFTRCNEVSIKDRDCNIFYSFLDGGMRGEPIRLDIETPPTYDLVMGHPWFCNELDMLFFVSNMEGGQGNKDIWVTKYDRENDSWGKPKNLGKEVNTDGTELFPSTDAEGNLYFSSYGAVNFGGLDIFKATRKGDMEWGDVENMKSPINSSADDFGIVFNNSQKTGYFTSNRKGGLGMDDIYEFKLIDAPSKVDTIPQETSDKKDDENINSLVHLFNAESCEATLDDLKISSITAYPNPSDGLFTLSLNINKSTPLTLRLFSSHGKLVSSEIIAMQEGPFTREFNIQQESVGIYYLQILYNCETIYTQKLVKK